MQTAPVTAEPTPQPEPDGPVLFDALLHPHRSLSANGFFWLMAALIGLSLAMGLSFLALGAWPIFGLYGVDVLLVWLAFRANYRVAARHWERVRLTPGRLTVDRHGPAAGQYGQWQFQPHWLQVRMDDPPEHHSQVILSSHGRSLAVGSFLSPDERLDFAKALRGALERVRQWRAS